MPSVTQLIRNYVKQPLVGYIRPKNFSMVNIEDENNLQDGENIFLGLIGMAVDYLTRLMLGELPTDAFGISLAGARLISDEDNAIEILAEIKGLNDKSIRSACKLVGYDVVFRKGKIYYCPVEDIKPNSKTISNIRIMVNRSLKFLGNMGQ